ncbi:unnamed protein product [Sphagnum jensenii]
MTTVSCSGVAFSVTPVNGTNGIIPAGTLYTWVAPTGAGFTGGLTQASAVNTITGTLTNTTSSAQTATYIVTPTTVNCGVGAPFSLTVSLNPKATITAMTTVSCSGVLFTVTPTDVTNGIVPAGTLYSWSVPTVTGGLTGGVSATNASVISGTLANPTNIVQTATYIVTPISGNCTGAAFALTVTINPVATVTAMSTTACNGIAFNVTPVNGTNGIVPAGTLYTWAAPTGVNFTGGAAQGSGVNTITGTLTNTTNTAQTATYIITPSTVSCGAGTTFTLTVLLNPGATITAMSTTTCTGVTFTVTPTDGINGIIRQEQYLPGQYQQVLALQVVYHKVLE